MRTFNDGLDDILNGFSASIFVEKPCRVTRVNSQYSVDIEYYDNGIADYLYNVPVKHLQTQSAYVFLGLKSGDCGTVRFFDNDTDDYMNSSSQKIQEIRTHDINDNLFSAGFYPLKSQYVFPSGDIVIGTCSGAVINITGESITISGGTINIEASTVNLGSETVIDGKKFLEHTHSNGNNGNPTGGVV